MFACVRVCVSVCTRKKCVCMCFCVCVCVCVSILYVCLCEKCVSFVCGHYVLVVLITSTLFIGLNCASLVSKSAMCP